VSLYPAESREFLQSELLFEAFHRSRKRLDELILRQIPWGASEEARGGRRGKGGSARWERTGLGRVRGRRGRR
jgi:hypothetical protein